MHIHDVIRKLREEKRWSQEEMANRVGMSKNGYAKMERGESRPSLDRLEKITQVLGIEMTELFNEDKKSVVLINENSQNSANYYSSDQQLTAEIERLKLELSYKDIVIAQKDEQIALLKRLANVSS
ncbi:helix-turn-helix domain-containing protein [Moraxella ovis]|uniref:helix-turn-helix domain-containing protein n=1 Tax=Moraxella ovis TaxID=29433 RepID=UPI000D8534F4|nr:helix-turn-helix transcriptional regulator [Moraxella ovis]SPX85400.1 transcription factor [Moraxella ovis]STZ06297.1 transcription factor [Moraxella ovis]